MASFAEALKKAREERGITQYALAKAAGITRQAMSSLESGLNSPTWDTVQRLALALGVDCRLFVDDDLALTEPEPARPRGRPKNPPAEVEPEKKPKRRKRKGK